ncbi:hypothetical protein [Trichocoleus sp. DQ-A3]
MSIFVKTIMLLAINVHNSDKLGFISGDRLDEQGIEEGKWLG